MGISIDGCDVVSPPPGRLIGLVNITLQRRLLKKVASHKGLEDTCAMCSSFELYLEVRPGNVCTASWQVPVYHQTTSVSDPKGGLGGAHASKGQREILETRQQGFSISWISLTLLIVLVYQAHHFFIGKCF